MARTRHALLRDDSDPQYRDSAELTEPELHAVIKQQVTENADVPGYQIVERQRSTEAVWAGRHPGTSRLLAAIGVSGKEIARAFEYPDYWQIDVENHTIKIAGMDWRSGVIDGFCVRSENEAYDWLSCSVR